MTNRIIFLGLCLVQLFTVFGAGVTAFSLNLWAWEQTNLASTLSTAMFFGFLPGVLLGPLAGAIIDKHGRKRIIIGSIAGTAVVTGALIVLSSINCLSIVMVFIANVLYGLASSFLLPAFHSLITKIVSKKDYTRANGFFSVAESSSNVLAPVLASVLYPLFGLSKILALEVFMSVASGIVILTYVKQDEKIESNAIQPTTLFQDVIAGFKWLLGHTRLLKLQTLFFFLNLVLGLSFTLTLPYLLLRSGNNEFIAGSLRSIAAAGGIAGGLFLGVLHIRRKKITIILSGIFILGVSQIILGIGPSFHYWAISGFFSYFVVQIINGAAISIWQEVVPFEMQGRILAIRRFVSQISYPVAMIISGPLSDFVFEPLGARVGWIHMITLSTHLSSYRGVGTGLLLAIVGVCCMVIAFVGRMSYDIRHIENQ